MHTCRYVAEIDEPLMCFGSEEKFNGKDGECANLTEFAFAYACIHTCMFTCMHA
jgi:hypothetical protein